MTRPIPTTGAIAAADLPDRAAVAAAVERLRPHLDPHACDAVAHALGHHGRRGRREVREPPVHRIVQGAWCAQPPARPAAGGWCGGSVGGKPRPGGGPPCRPAGNRRRHRHAGRHSLREGGENPGGGGPVPARRRRRARGRDHRPAAGRGGGTHARASLRRPRRHRRSGNGRPGGARPVPRPRHGGRPGGWWGTGGGCRCRAGGDRGRGGGGPGGAASPATRAPGEAPPWPMASPSGSSAPSQRR